MVLNPTQRAFNVYPLLLPIPQEALQCSSCHSMLSDIANSLYSKQIKNQLLHEPVQESLSEYRTVYFIISRDKRTKAFQSVSSDMTKMLSCSFISHINPLPSVWKWGRKSGKDWSWSHDNLFVVSFSAPTLRHFYWVLSQTQTLDFWSRSPNIIQHCNDTIIAKKQTNK